LSAFFSLSFDKANLKQTKRMKPSLIFFCLLTQALNAIAQDSLNHQNFDSALSNIKLQHADNIAVISLSDDELENPKSQNISSLLTASRDPFLSATSYSFNFLHYRFRGYENNTAQMQMNGLTMNDIYNGSLPYNSWSGLNDVMHNITITGGVSYNAALFTKGGINSSIDSRAGKQRKQTTFEYTFSDRNYQHRIAVSHNTGYSLHGWAFSFSASHRWANEGYVPGSFYNSWSYFVGIDKKIRSKNVISFVLFGAPTQTGRQAASTIEMQQLAATKYYNPYWGNQNNQKRNAYTNTTYEPYAILTHDLHLNKNINILTAIGYSYGERNSAALDWYNAPDPRPDYYGYMPSNQANDALKQQVANAYQSNVSLRQINWQQLYDINRDNAVPVYGATTNQPAEILAKRSLYILQDRVLQTRKFVFNSTFHFKISEHLNTSAGLYYQSQVSANFQRINDLLGGDFFVDINPYAEQDYPTSRSAEQNDLNHPDRIVTKGDKYGYNYDAHITNKSIWLQNIFTFNHIDFFIAGQFDQTDFWRNGNVKTGLFPDDSYGKSADHKFTNYAVKAGLNYKINGRNYIFLNALYQTRPPYFSDAYVSPRTRDFVQDSLMNATTQIIEAGYVLNAPTIRVRLNMYYATFNNEMDVVSFYHDDYHSYVNYALHNINKTHYGIELGTETKLFRNITLNAAIVIGKYVYTTNETATVTLDNSAAVLDKQTVNCNNFKVPSTPQQVYTIGLTYRSPKYWFINANVNYYDNLWLEFNPLRRTAEATKGVDSTSVLYHNIVDQQKLQSNVVVNAYAGYSWSLRRFLHLHKPMYLVLSTGVDNLLNNQNIIAGGYEQLRFDFTNHNVNKFPSKYYYAYGITYFLNATLRF
jgi:hypothetical protein